MKHTTQEAGPEAPGSGSATIVSLQLTIDEARWLWTTVSIAGDVHEPDPEQDIVLRKLEASMDAAGVAAAAPMPAESQGRAAQLVRKLRG